MPESADAGPLPDARLDLERITVQEQDLRLAVDGMAACLLAVGTADPADSADRTVARLLAALRPVFGFDAAFLVMRGADGVLTAVGATATRFAGTRWPDDGRIAGLVAGQATAIADIAGEAEWDGQPEVVRDGVRATLQLALREGRHPAIVVCSHPRAGFFDSRHLRLTGQLAPVLAQALYLHDQATELRRCRQQLTGELDALGDTDDDFSMTPPPVAAPPPTTQSWRRPTAGAPPAVPPPMTQGWKRPAAPAAAAVPAAPALPASGEPPAPLTGPAPAVAMPPLAAAGTTSRWSRKATQATVLVVEDSPVNQVLTLGFLRKLGCTPLLAENGELALAMLAGNAVDCVLMDLHMPGIDGRETTRRLRASGIRGSSGRHLPVLGLTASTEAEEHRTCIESGMDEVLTKPLRLDDLTAKIRTWCG